MSFLRTMRAVAWAFLGVRKRSGLEGDMQRLNPLQVFLVALVFVALLVAGLIVLVNWIV